MIILVTVHTITLARAKLTARLTAIHRITTIPMTTLVMVTPMIIPMTTRTIMRQP